VQTELNGTGNNHLNADKGKMMASKEWNDRPDVTAVGSGTEQHNNNRFTALGLPG